MVAAATATIDRSPPPHHGHNHGPVHGHDHFHEDGQEHSHEHGQDHGHDHVHELGQEHGQQHGHVHVHEPDHPKPEPIPAEPSEENYEDEVKEIVNLKRQPNAEDIKQNIELESNDEIVEENQTKDEVSTSSKQGVLWVACEFGSTPILSCFDCNSRLRCIWSGGKVIPCDNPTRPYCNSGFCSSIPGVECSMVTTGPRN